MDNFDLLKKFDCIVEEKLENDLKCEIEAVKSQYGFNDDDISFFVGRNFSDDNEYHIEDLSAFELARLYELCFPLSETRDIINEYIKNKNTSLDEKVMHLLNLFDIKDEKSLDRLIETIIDVRSSIYEVDKEAKQVDKELQEVEKEISGTDAEIDNSDNGHCKCHDTNEEPCCCSREKTEEGKDCCKKEQDEMGHGNVIYSYFDSNTMDKPKTATYSFDLSPEDWTSIFNDECCKQRNYSEYSKRLASFAEKLRNFTKQLDLKL